VQKRVAEVVVVVVGGKVVVEGSVEVLEEGVVVEVVDVVEVVVATDTYGDVSGQVVRM
jgi:hypothetical protein